VPLDQIVDRVDGHGLDPAAYAGEIEAAVGWGNKRGCVTMLVVALSSRCPSPPAKRSTVAKGAWRTSDFSQGKPY
jgi:hypothetical protein